MKHLFVLIITFITLNANSRDKAVVIQRLDSMSYLIDSLDVDEPMYVMAQAIYESGWFDCKNCSWSSGNNMFGFVGKNGKYMQFNTWQECVIYYSKWQKARYPIFKKKYPFGTYLGFLKWCNYSQSEIYSKEIQWTYNWVLNNWKFKD